MSWSSASRSPRAHKWPTVRVQAEEALLNGVDLLVTALRVWPTLGGEPGDRLLQTVGEACEAAARQAGDQRLASARQAGGMETMAAVTAADQARSVFVERPRTHRALALARHILARHFPGTSAGFA
jgi:hypothetical protein